MAAGAPGSPTVASPRPAPGGGRARQPPGRGVWQPLSAENCRRAAAPVPCGRPPAGPCGAISGVGWAARPWENGGAAPPARQKWRRARQLTAPRTVQGVRASGDGPAMRRPAPHSTAVKGSRTMGTIEILSKRGPSGAPRRHPVPPDSRRSTTASSRSTARRTARRLMRSRRPRPGAVSHRAAP